MLFYVKLQAATVCKGLVALIVLIRLLPRVDSGHSGAFSDDLFVKSVYDIDRTHKASHPYGYVSVFSDCMFAQSFYCIARICEVSHPCASNDEVSVQSFV